MTQKNPEMIGDLDHLLPRLEAFEEKATSPEDALVVKLVQYERHWMNRDWASPAEGDNDEANLKIINDFIDEFECNALEEEEAIAFLRDVLENGKWEAVKNVIPVLDKMDSPLSVLDDLMSAFSYLGSGNPYTPAVVQAYIIQKTNLPV